MLGSKHSVSSPSRLHDVAGRIGQHGADVGELGRPAELGGGSLGRLGEGTVSGLNSGLSTAGEHVRGMGTRLSDYGDRLHTTATNFEHNESTVAASFDKIRTRGTSDGVGTGAGPSRHKFGSGRFNPYGGRPSKGGAPEGSDDEGHGTPPGGSPEGSPDRDPTPPPAWGTPGYRPSGFDPHIPQDVHDHVSHGSYNAHGNVTGGHVFAGQTTTNPAGQAEGTIGYGARPQQGSPQPYFDTQPNNVYKMDSPEIVFDPQYGNVIKNHNQHTMFPGGTSDVQAHQLGSAAWNSPNVRFWPDSDPNKTGGVWVGSTTIPQGFPSGGQQIKIEGRWDQDDEGNVQPTTYYPHGKQQNF